MESYQRERTKIIENKFKNIDELYRK